MDNQNISVVNGKNKFNFRVAIIIENNDRVLLETSGEFWNMIGGRVKFGESSLDAAKRELKEEIGIEVNHLCLINVSENFFNWMGNRQQELLFVYRTNLSDEIDIVSKDEFECLDTNEIFKWHKKDDVKNIVCKPEIIKKLIFQNDDLSHNIENNI